MKHFGEKLTARERSTPKSERLAHNLAMQKPNLHDASREMTETKSTVPVLRLASSVQNQTDVIQSSSEDSIIIHETFNKMFQNVEKVSNKGNVVCFSGMSLRVHVHGA